MEFNLIYNPKDFSNYYKGVVIYQNPDEVGVLVDELNSVKNIRGALAEVGVFQGATAKIIREVFPNRPLFLFDTFEGFADELDESDPQHYTVGHCATSIEIVKKLMKGEDVSIIKGIFPETADIIKNERFSFVHIDVDIYRATKNSLEFFIPRMEMGGVIIVHDYPAHNGVKKAVDELLESGKLSKNSLRPKGIRQLIIKF